MLLLNLWFYSEHYLENQTMVEKDVKNLSNKSKNFNFQFIKNLIIRFLSIL